MVRWQGLMGSRIDAILLLRGMIERLCRDGVLAALFFVVVPASRCVSRGAWVGASNGTALG